MSDTPRTDAFFAGRDGLDANANFFLAVQLAGRLERELAAAQASEKAGAKHNARLTEENRKLRAALRYLVDRKDYLAILNAKLEEAKKLLESK